MAMEKIEYILDFCKELGKQMIVSGANIERVNLCVERICHAYGLHDVTCANLSTRISISAKDENKLYAHRQTDVPPQTINLERLKKLNNLSYFVKNNTPDVTTLNGLLKDIKTNDFPWWVMMIGFMVAMAGLGRLFLAGPAELLIIELNTSILFGLSKAFAKIHINKIITNFISMFVACLVATLFYKIGFVHYLFVIFITNAFYLIPGIPMINCARNLLCGNEMNGIIDLFKVLLEICSIVAGVAAAYAIFAGAIGNPLVEENVPPSPQNVWVGYLEVVILTTIATTGFSVVFNIQLKDIGFAALGGTIVRIVYILFQLAIPDFRFIYITLAAFFAALYSEIIAINRKEPSTLYLYPSIIPLIPGDLFYYVALGLVWQNHFISDYGPDLAFSLIGIPLGFVLCSTVVHYVRKFKILRKTNPDEEK